MDKLYICKDEDCGNTLENKGNLCCHSCTVENCREKCTIEFEECIVKFKAKDTSIKVHELKILPEYFSEVISGEKRFEIRKNDRNFKKGDRVILREFKDGSFTGNYANATIGYIVHG